ncbi:MAG: NAD(P)-binding domain-containing protein [Candidatus Acidiferrales bacterium]
METLLAFLIAGAVTFFFVRRYLKQLTVAQKPAAQSPSPSSTRSVETVPCPRCSVSIAKGTAFCAHCGAALVMWSVHRAQVQVSSGSEKSGKPKPVINASLCVGCGSCVEDCPETGTLEMAGGKAILANPDRCVGHAKCVAVCPTSAITLSFGGVLQTVKVPNVKENYETNIPGVFIVGELGGMGLIKTAVNEGKLAVDYIRARISEVRPRIESSGAQPNGSESYDVAIVGAGPAGLSATLTAQQHGLRYLALEQGEIASTIRQYPRHKFLMAEPIEIPLYGPLYVADGTKETLLSVWQTIIANTGVRIQTNERVERVHRNGEGFAIETAKGKYHAAYVILAIGKRGTPKSLGISGENLGKVAYKLIEAETYEGKDILIVGGGDSAVEAALALSREGRNRVTLSYRGDVFQRLRDRNLKLLETAEKESRLKILRKANLLEVHPASAKVDVAGTQVEIKNDFVFILIGGESPDEFLRRTGIEIVEKALSLDLERTFA